MKTSVSCAQGSAPRYGMRIDGSVSMPWLRPDTRSPQPRGSTSEKGTPARSSPTTTSRKVMPAVAAQRRRRSRRLHQRSPIPATTAASRNQIVRPTGAGSSSLIHCSAPNDTSAKKAMSRARGRVIDRQGRCCVAGWSG